MSPAFYILAALITVSATLAVTLRNLIHCALWLVLTFLGIAALYLHLGAEFVGLAQVLVYVGAVVMVVLFTILLTSARGEGTDAAPVLWLGFRQGGLIAFLVAIVIGVAVSKSPLPMGSAAAPPLPVADIGRELVTRYAVALQVVGLILTVALVGALIIASSDRGRKP